MESMEERLNKLREERIAREKARIDKLRELNLKKYNKNDAQTIPRTPSIVSLANRSIKPDIKRMTDTKKSNLKNTTTNQIQNNFNVNSNSKRPITAPVPSNKLLTVDKTKPLAKDALTNGVAEKTVAEVKNIQIMKSKNLSQIPEKKDFVNINKIIAKSVPKQSLTDVKKSTNMTRKSLAPIKITSQLKLPEKLKDTRKSMLPMRPVSVSKNRESVFDRLYKPKTVPKTQMTDAERLKVDPVFLQKVMQQSSLISNKRHTIFTQNITKPVTKDPVRRSISAVHFKRISKQELGNCIQKWSSIGEKLDKIHVTNTNEDEKVAQDTVTSAVKSERKRVRLQTPVSFTPRPQELQNRLQNWLKTRGKSIDSYQHLQCFGIHHLAESPMKAYSRPDEKPMETYDDENKENIALEHDSDNDSYADCINDDFNENDKTKWRGRVSLISDSVCLNDSEHDTTVNSEEAPVDDVLLGALIDLTALLREGFDWDQSARWLRAIRGRFPHAPALPAYWECRAALEEARGDLPASLQCWEEALATGTKHSVVEANLDQLLDKFMQLKISPNSGKRDKVDSKLVDMKNVFKSTIIRFAVQQAKLRQSNQSEQPTFTMTPVRRSGRISSRWSSKPQKTPRHQKTPLKTPLQICASVRQAELLGEKVTFVPNPTLCNTP